MTEMGKPKVSRLRLAFRCSFQICHPKKPSDMVRTPSSSVTFVSPVKSRSYDISFPSFDYSPPSNSPLPVSPFESISRGFDKSRTEERVFNSPVSSEFDETMLLITPPRSERRNYRNASKKSIDVSISSDGSDENDDSLFSPSPIFTPPLCNQFNHPFKTSKKAAKQTRHGSQRFKRIDSKEWNLANEHHHHHERKPSLSSRFVPCMRDADVDESFIVVKRSINPYEDFKNSMLEMILDKQILEPKELEHLLMSYLSLNSRIHHKVIIEAFTEIMKYIFS